MKTATMTGRNVTEESVVKACADLTKLSLTPTVHAVRDHIGGGSPTAIAPLLKMWKDNQRKVAPQGQAREQQLACKSGLGARVAR